MKIILAGLILSFLVSPAPADKIYTERSVWEGTIIRETGSQVQLRQADGSIINMPRSQVIRIEYTAEEDAVNILSAIESLKQSAETSEKAGDWEEALSFYREIIAEASKVRERAGSLYEEALSVKEKAEAEILTIQEAVRRGEIFIEAEASPEAVLRKKGIEFTAEEFLKAADAGDNETLGLFILGAMDVDSRGEGGQTALMRSCAAGHLESAEKLLEAGADISLKDDQGRTALHAAFKSRDPLIIRLIVDKTHNG
jgi:tetratricopeptide (TPR) repeat protein